MRNFRTLKTTVYYRTNDFYEKLFQVKTFYLEYLRQIFFNLQSWTKYLEQSNEIQ